MKKLFFLSLLTLLNYPVYAEVVDQIPESLSMKINFNYTLTDLKGKPSQFTISNNLDMSTTTHDWILVQNEQTLEAPTRLILLGKIDQANAEGAKISFIVIDTEDDARVISKPEVMVRYGEPAKLALADQNAKMSLSILADA